MKRTGWPPGLLQDDCRELSKWFASRLGARRLVREASQMNEQQAPPESLMTFAGDPMGIGVQVWNLLCLPAVRACGHAMPPQALGQLYAGFLMAALGAMTADFGPEQAASFAHEIMDSFDKLAASIHRGGSALQ